MSAAVGERTFDELCEEGRSAMDSLDDGRWTLGELALQIETQYNAHTIEEFAKQVGAEKSRVYEYRKVYGFYADFLPVQKFREETPMLRYSHYRDAMRLKTADKVLDWLNEVNGNGYTVEEARVKLCKRLGKPVPPRKLGEYRAKFGALFHIADDLRIPDDQWVVVRIYEDGD